MGKSVWKDLFREIKRTFGRFIAIFAIVAIGVAFFAGVTASSNDMKNSTDNYYDDYNMSDLRLLSSIGFNEDDIKAIRAVDGVKGVYPAYSQDAVIRKDSIETAVHIMSVPDNTDRNNENYINQLRIKEGRLPENSGECVVRYEDTKDNFSIGDTIKLSSGTQDDINDSLKDSEYTVVGTVYTPYYVSYDLGTTNVGSGRINYLMYITEDEFMSDYFNEVFATVDGAKELDTYGTEYKDLVKETADRIDNISQSRINVRKDDIQDVYEDSVNEAKEAAKKVIYDHVVESLTEQYSNYFVGMDVSAIIEPYIQPAYEKALADYDFSSIEAQAKEDFESKYANTSSMVVEYKFTITNEGGIAGYVKKLADYLPEELKFNSELNKDWYEGKDGVIYNASLANTIINPGESIALVGKTGSGKTTITNLINRFYKIQKGEILLDGVNINDINLKSLRKNIGTILQDPFIFAKSLKDNIKLYSDVSDERINEAVKLASATDFINSQNNGINEISAERGNSYSAGQKQLIAFARIFAQNPSIFILDEATANIDTTTEELIQKSVDKISAEKTSIFIAHRLSTIVNVDKIIVLNKGKILEQGNHSELLQKDGYYAKLYNAYYNSLN